VAAGAAFPLNSETSPAVAFPWRWQYDAHRPKRGEATPPSGSGGAFLVGAVFHEEKCAGWRGREDGPCAASVQTAELVEGIF
jgi:hypothetical protein